ncbi:MAG: hypothetical protein AAF958_06635 [Planctomycetota bacterium]
MIRTLVLGVGLVPALAFAAIWSGDQKTDNHQCPSTSASNLVAVEDKEACGVGVCDGGCDCADGETCGCSVCECATCDAPSDGQASCCAGSTCSKDLGAAEATSIASVECRCDTCGVCEDGCDCCDGKPCTCEVCECTVCASSGDDCCIAG